MPSQLSCVTATFQSVSRRTELNHGNTVARYSCGDGLHCDILITGKSDEERLETLEKVLVCLEESGLKLKWSKCLLMAPSVTYLVSIP